MFFQFLLRQNREVDGALMPGISRQPDISRRVYLKARAESGLDLTYCSISFAHEIRWGIQNWMISDWQKQNLGAEEKSGWASWVFREKQREELKMKVLDPSWNFDCPICANLESFICGLDKKELEKGWEGSIKLTTRR